MKTRKELNRISGWFPQEPTMGVIKSANLDLKSTGWVTLPFLATGILMTVAAVISAYFGFNLLSDYQTSLYNGHFVPVDYASLYVGLLNFVAVGLDLFAAMLLFLKKHVVLAEVLAALVLAFGLTAFFIISYNFSPEHSGYYSFYWLEGLFAGLPMIAASVPTLILIRYNYRKLKLETSKRWKEFPFVLSGVSMLVAFVLPVYIALSFVYSSATATYYGSNYFLVLSQELLFLIAIAVGLCAGVLLVLRKRISVALVLTIAVLAFEMVSPFFTFGAYLHIGISEVLPLAVVCAFVTLILVSLNRKKLEPSNSPVLRYMLWALAVGTIITGFLSASGSIADEGLKAGTSVFFWFTCIVTPLVLIYAIVSVKRITKKETQTRQYYLLLEKLRYRLTIGGKKVVLLVLAVDSRSTSTILTFQRPLAK